ncbi:MAG: MBL fold metallo-hydrolase [Gammaproteobacteria bacterium]
MADLNRLTYQQDYVIQRLTEKTYWVSVRGYSILFHVGENGVVLFDSPGDGRSRAILDAIASVTEWPVTTLIYSHSHLDHIGGAKTIARHARDRGRDLEIVATSKVIEEIGRFSLDVPAPTLVASVPEDRLSLQGLDIRIHTPEAYAHRPDTSLYYLPEERVIQAVDLITPGQLPYFSFNWAMDPKAFRDNLELMRSLDWDFLDAGHGNVGNRSDIRLSLDYYDDLANAIRTASKTVDKGEFYGPGFHPYESYRNFMAALADKVYEKMKDKYGRYGGLREIINGHVEMLRIQQVLHGQ